MRTFQPDKQDVLKFIKPSKQKTSAYSGPASCLSRLDLPKVPNHNQSYHRKPLLPIQEMGVCLSCIRSNDDDTASRIDENSHLLGESSQNNYDNDAMIQKRQEELNQIVNETNENLIDVNTFFSANATSLAELSLQRSDKINNDLKDIKPAGHVNGSIDYYEDEEDELDGDELLKLVQEETKIVKKGPLIEQFD